MEQVLMRTKRSSYIFAKKKPLSKRISAKISELMPKKQYHSNYSFDLKSISVAQASDFIANPPSRSNYSKPEPSDYARFDSSYANEGTLEDDFIEFDMRRAALAADANDFDMQGFDSSIGSYNRNSGNIFSRIADAIHNATRQTAIYLSGAAAYLAIIAIAALMIVNSNAVGVSMPGYSSGYATEEKTIAVLVEDLRQEICLDSDIFTADSSVNEG